MVILLGLMRKKLKNTTIVLGEVMTTTMRNQMGLSPRPVKTGKNRGRHNSTILGRNVRPIGKN